jgi:RimJ/RimL family protein N-acetyltransferase
MNPYNYRLIKRSFAEGHILTGFSLLVQFLRAKISNPRRYVYGLHPSDWKYIALNKEIKVTIRLFNKWGTVPQSLKDQLLEYPELIWWDNQKLIEQGGMLWVVLIHDKLACLGYSRQGDTSYFFKIHDDEVLLSHFATLPQFRGKKLYPHLLSIITKDLLERGAAYFFIDCNDYNLASQRGIEQAGFTRIGIGMIARRQKNYWIPIQRPLVQAFPKNVNPQL